MVDIQETEKTFQLLYNAAAKPLYNLAIYAIGDQQTAERILTDVFVEVFYTIPDQSDPDLFKKKCIKSLYRHARKIRIKQKHNGSTAPFKIEGKQQLYDILSKFGFTERYIILLFCWQRFSLEKIAETICRPKFIVRKRLYSIVKKAARVSEV